MSESSLRPEPIITLQNIHCGRERPVYFKMLVMLSEVDYTSERLLHFKKVITLQKTHYTPIIAWKWTRFSRSTIRFSFGFNASSRWVWNLKFRNMLRVFQILRCVCDMRIGNLDSRFPERFQRFPCNIFREDLRSQELHCYETYK